MDAFSYLSVLISIVIGLAITQLLSGYRTLLIARGRVRTYAPTLIWGGLLLLIDVQGWWAMFGMRAHGSWTFVQFALVLLQAILLYMLAALVFPDVAADHTVDLREHYFNQSRWFFGFGVLLLVVSVVKDLGLTGSWPTPINLAFHGLFLVMWGTAAWTRSEVYHRVLPILTAIAFCAYIVVLFTRL